MTIEKLITSIIEKYVKIEKQLINFPYRYYTFYEFDANNATKFEELSNAYLIGIKSKLHESDVNVIIHIFKAICDKNYYIFDSDYFCDDDIPEYLLNSIKTYDNTNDWIEVLKYSSKTFNITSTKLIPWRENLLRNRYTLKLVNPHFKKIKQKYYLINEIEYNKEYF